MYLRTSKSTRIIQGKPQAPKKVLIIIVESLSKNEDIRPCEGNIEELTPKTKTKTPIAFVGGPTTRLVTLCKSWTQAMFEKE